VTTILKASNLETYYGKSHILHDVSLEVGEGEIVTLLGRNGAGKTTTLRSLIGLTPPREGQVQIFGQDTTNWAAHRISRLGVGYVPEGRKIFPNLTVLENLTVPVARPGMWTIERIFELFPNLGERRDSWGRQLSGGEQEMLAIARALLINPKLLLLDEPSQGLAPLLVRDVFRVVASMRKEGISILLVEQNARFGLEVADRVYVLNNGEVVHSGSASDLAKDETRVRALAGVGGKEGERSGSRKAAAT
jgi:branched-chain amino acid transport system ATP-binding protein